MEYEWVIGRFTGERAKSVKAHADAGIGYFIRQELGQGMAYAVEAAFRRPCDGLLPEHLERVTWSQASKLEKMLQERM